MGGRSRNPFFPKPVPWRKQFGDEDKPLWGASFDGLCDLPRKEVSDVLEENSNPDVERIINQFVAGFRSAYGSRGLGRTAARDLLFRIGAMLNEIAEREEARNG